MGQETGIQWATHTWNPWRGCAKVSEGCAHCYAEAMSVRNPKVLGIWGNDGTRPFGSDAYMRQPYRWDREAAHDGIRSRVFCGSLMDIFECRDDLLEQRRRVLMTAYECHHLDWLFLTKRPQNIKPCLEAATHMHYPHENWLELQMRTPRYNWWLGCTVENHRRAVERIDVLLDVPAKVRFLSCEPLLEPLDLSPWLATGGIDWVIVGGESNQGGATARMFDISWAEEIVEQCKAYNVPCFVKQFGSVPVADGLGLKLRERHGGDMNEWPDWMRVRQIPRLHIVSY